MEPYYRNEEYGIELWQGDCLEVLPLLAPGSVDAVVTDPPYGGLHGGYRMVVGGGVAAPINPSVSVGDKWNANFEWAQPACRVARFGVVVFCTYHALPETVNAFSGLRRAVLWTWHKRNAPPTGKNVPRFTEEYAWGFAKQPGLRWDAVKSTLIDVPKLATGCMASKERVVDERGKALHPTQKPVSVMERVLSVVPNSVCDPFMGSGTTGVACVNTGRRFIGIELNADYCRIAQERIEKAIEERKRAKQREMEFVT